MFKKVTILGAGLIGGSLGMALKKRGLAGEVCGWGRRPDRLRLAVELGALDTASLSLENAVHGAGLLVLATPVSTFFGLLKEAAKFAPAGCLATDVGSVKGARVARWHEAALPMRFVASHPMAGSEKTGVIAASPDLFESATCVTTPLPSTSRPALARVEAMWRAVGSRVVRLDPKRHDRVIGLLSHLPHAAAFALSKAVLSNVPAKDWFLAGNGFKDTTRVGASDAAMWADIFWANRARLKQGLQALIRELAWLQALVEGNDSRALQRYLERASALRKKWR